MTAKKKSSGKYSRITASQMYAPSDLPKNLKGVQSLPEKYELTFKMDGKALSEMEVATIQAFLSKTGRSFTSFGGTGDEVLDASGKIAFQRPDQSHASDTRAFFCLFSSGPHGYLHDIILTPETPLFAFAESFADLIKRENGLVDVSSSELSIQLQYPENRQPSFSKDFPGVIHIWLSPFPESQSGNRNTFGGVNCRLEVNEAAALLRKAGPGNYEFQAWLPGCAHYKIEEPVSITDDKTVNLKLAPGFQLKLPSAFSDRDRYSFSLLKKEDDPLQPWKNIPQIDFVHSIHNWSHLSIGEFWLSAWEKGSPNTTLLDIEFEIESDSLEIIDLETLEQTVKKP